MTVSLVPRPVMPGYNSVDLDEVHSLSSDFSYTRPSMVSNTSGMFSFSQTEPSTDLMNGSSWATTGEGQQNFQDFSDNGSSHSGESEEYMYRSGQTTPRGTRQGRQDMRNSWNASRIAAMPKGGQAMSRIGSNRSNGSSLSNTSHMSHIDITGNTSAFRTGSQTGVAVGGMNSCLLLDSDAEAMPNQMCWPGYPLEMAFNPEASFIPDVINPLHIVPAHMQLGPDSTLADNSSTTTSWDCFSSPISRSSSPASIDDTWLPAPISPHSSPEILCQSPSIDHKIGLIPEDLSSEVLPKLEDGLSLSPAFGPRRQANDGESARDHHLYKNVAPMNDGLYHCPWEGQASCNHKPEKLKCNYDKFVDSHLKPYRCKAESCEGARFSSTACLLRHEREAHGLHGHGDKPFLCVYEGCERAVPGNGFPRQWNLRDHMKRVHNDHGSAGSSPPTTAAQPAKSRKRKTEVPEVSSTPSRKASTKAMPPAETKQESARPLLDQWMDHRKAAESIFQVGLVKPDDTRNIEQINEMQKHLSIMAKMTTDLTAMTKGNMMPAARGIFTGTG